MPGETTDKIFVEKPKLVLRPCALIFTALLTGGCGLNNGSSLNPATQFSSRAQHADSIFGEKHTGAGQEWSFSEHFDGEYGQSPDPSRWTFDVGGGGWGNEEVQLYTASSNNAFLTGDGRLVIEARNDDGVITSARLTTKDRFSFTFGRAEARIKLPSGQGTHAGMWMLGTDIDEVGWPKSGEINVAETLNDSREHHTVLHGPVTESHPDYPQGRWSKGSWRTFPEPLGDDFYTYWVERRPASIRIGIDDVTFAHFQQEQLEPGQEWVFDKPFYLLFSLAIGGVWPGPPQLDYPVRMEIDWVRVTEYRGY